MPAHLPSLSPPTAPQQAYKTSPNPDQVQRLGARGGGKGLGDLWASLAAWASRE